MEEAPALAAQHHELDGVLSSLSEADWSRPSRCPGWDVADVVVHLAQTDEMAVASLEDRLAGFMAAAAEGAGGPAVSTVDDGAALMVARERGAPPAEVHARWRAAAARLDERLAAEDGHRRVQWVGGELSVRTLTVTRLAECWIHAGDVAEAVGAQLVPDERLRHVARLAWRTLPYAFAREGRELSGPVGFELAGPGGETWSFRPEGDPVTMVRGDGVELCLVAGRRVDPSETSLIASGQDGEVILSLVRTYA